MSAVDTGWPRRRGRRAWAEQAWLGNLKVAPALDAVRGDPRFNRMLQRAHLAD